MRPILPFFALLAGAALSGAVAQVSTPQEQAEFLAGIPLPRASSLRPLQLSPEYRSHQDKVRSQWSFCRQVRYEAMRRWGSVYLANYPAARGVLRYLFGGPDFLNAYAFFPDARVMVLGGLEPVGEVPPPEALSPTSLGPALDAVDDALHTSLFEGYFITTEMRPQLTAGAFRGVLPVLYTELALTGNLIDAVSMERPFGSPGVKIMYHRPGGGSQTLWYFQADLANGKECRRFLSWLGELGPGSTYLKAASFLLPRDCFSETRNFLIRSSELILQDDSGLPYRCFLPGVWRISLFGVYTDPLEIFRLGRDPALAEAFDSPLRVAPLAFGAGYHVNGDDANLLLAVRDNAAILAENLQSATPAAIPAFAVLTPPPGRIRIRKAKPIPIRKAIPIATPRATPVFVPLAPPSSAAYPVSTTIPRAIKRSVPSVQPSPGITRSSPTPALIDSEATVPSPSATPAPEVNPATTPEMTTVSPVSSPPDLPLQVSNPTNAPASISPEVSATPVESTTVPVMPDISNSVADPVQAIVPNSHVPVVPVTIDGKPID